MIQKGSMVTHKYDPKSRLIVIKTGYAFPRNVFINGKEVHKIAFCRYLNRAYLDRVFPYDPYCELVEERFPIKCLMK